MQFIKQPYFQLGILVFVYLLFLVMLGNGIATTLFLVLLLCASYILANRNEKPTKLANWLRVMIYAVLIYNLYYILATMSTDIHVVKLFSPDISTLKLIQRVYVDYFWESLIIIILAFILVMNRRKKAIIQNSTKQMG